MAAISGSEYLSIIAAPLRPALSRRPRGYSHSIVEGGFELMS
jgi:hypothetical protein